ncbi:bile acid:sodium symporter [Actinomadura sp. ATCC 31491]|uniref:Bile acid:sodium symporter n=1 Tax=Actinomadura luzonensis TaxID=2805427 RepID=A0ABT0FN41_9ACTN|nr:bile acid:sodium symporter [Actinomadura luzonensis]MCK2213754.1 bile acid:sodium symporter [Actinomadura luzonensis]
MTARVMAFAQRWLLGLMLGCYALAGAFPGPGERLRALRLPWPAVPLTAPMLLLAVMLANAGLGVRVGDLRGVLRRPSGPVLGVAVNALLPVVLLPAVAVLLRPWPDAGEVEFLLVGLMLVLAMPIAGGAASWGQNAGGNVPMIVAMVVGSTLLSPVTVPLGLRLAGRLVGPSGTGGLDDTARLDGLAGAAGAGAFALASVVLPCLAGMAARALLGERRAARALPAVKAVNLAVILLLCYVNAAGALARALSRPDPDLFVLAFAVPGAVCGLSFLLGGWLSRWPRRDAPDRISLTFATGMNNTSAAAVLASAWFAHRPETLLPILSYSLLQKVMASVVTRPGVAGRSDTGPAPS